jgi:hypothetical protein
VLARGLFSGEVEQRSVIRVYVTQWEVEEDQPYHHEAAISRILELLEGAGTSTPLDLPTELGGLAQVVIRFDGAEVVTPA